MNVLLPPPRLFPPLVAAASAAVLATAFGFQYLGGLEPCPLCIWQRYPYGAAIALALAAWLVPGARARGGLMALAGLVFLVGAGIAGFHVGVEQHWWEGTAECVGGLSAELPVGSLLARAQATVPVRCDEVPWSLFGISMAGYNVLLSLALAAASLFAAKRLIGEAA